MLYTRNIRILFVAVIAEFISFGVLLPIVPLLFTEPSSSFYMLPGNFSVNMGYILLGLMVGLYPLGQFFSTPILGELSDRYGRKKVMQISIVGTIVTSIAFGLGITLASIPLLLLSRLFNGLTGGMISVAQAAIADESDREHKSQNFGAIGAAIGVGLMLGPFLGGLLSSDLLGFFSATTPFYFAAVVSGLSLVMITKELRETSPMEQKNINWKKPFTQLKKGLKMQGMKKIFTTNFFYFSGFSFFTTFIPVYLVKGFGLSQFEVGNYYLYVGLLVIIGQGYLVGKLYSRISEEKAAPYVIFLTGLFLFLQPVPSSFLIFLAVIAVFAINNSFANIALYTLVSNHASDRDQGLALGTNQSVRSLANAIPSMLSGIAAALTSPGFALMIAGAIVMLTAVGYKITEFH
jgi:DHA1 family tetracycline resistance protein-like MFS transporter